MPKTFLILVFIVGTLLFVKEYYQAHRSRSGKKSFHSKKYPFIRKPSLLTNGEQVLWRELNQAAGKDSFVLGKVRLADVVKPKPGLKGRQAATALDEIAAVSLDFVICRKSDMAVQAGVKLAESNGRNKSEADETACVKGALSAAGVPLLQLEAKEKYTAATLSVELERAREALATETKSLKKAVNRPLRSKHTESAAAVSDSCPACGARMVSRRVRGGRMNGTYVLACNNYPSCKQILPMSIQAAAIAS